MFIFFATHAKESTVVFASTRNIDCCKSSQDSSVCTFYFCFYQKRLLAIFSITYADDRNQGVDITRTLSFFVLYYELRSAEVRPAMLHEAAERIGEIFVRVRSGTLTSFVPTPGRVRVRTRTRVRGTYPHITVMCK